MNFKEIKSNFIAFLVIFAAIGFIGRLFDFDTTVYEKNISEHVSELMSEHEALKTLYFVSIILILAGFLKSALYALNIKCDWIRTSFIIPLSNFISTLAVISVAISLAVYFTSIKIMGLFSVILLIPILNSVLAGLLIYSLYIFSQKESTLKKFSCGVFSSGVYLLILFRDVILF